MPGDEISKKRQREDSEEESTVDLGKSEMEDSVMEEVNTETKPPKKPAKKKRRILDPEKDTIFWLRNWEPHQIEDLENAMDTLAKRQNAVPDFLKSHGMLTMERVEVARVHINQTPKERREVKTLYRRVYSKKPNVVAKRRERDALPESIERRKKYNQDPATKEKKKFKRKSLKHIFKLLEEEDPERVKRELEVLRQKELEVALLKAAEEARLHELEAPAVPGG